MNRCWRAPPTTPGEGSIWPTRRRNWPISSDRTNLWRRKPLIAAAISTSTALVAEDPKNASYRSQLAVDHNNLGLFFATRSPVEAETSFRRCTAYRRGLAAEFPEEPALWRAALRSPRQSGGHNCETLEKPMRRSSSNFAAYETIDKLAADHPDVPEYQSRISEKLIDRLRRLIERASWRRAQLAGAGHRKAANCFEGQPGQSLSTSGTWPWSWIIWEWF